MEYFGGNPVKVLALVMKDPDPGKNRSIGEHFFPEKKQEQAGSSNSPGCGRIGS
jgi:hypothetical protein